MLSWHMIGQYYLQIQFGKQSYLNLIISVTESTGIECLG